jgi:hypothetical protein
MADYLRAGMRETMILTVSGWRFRPGTVTQADRVLPDGT